MAIQLSVAARNDRLDSFETTTGTAAKLEIRTGAQPATCATASSGTVLATMSLPTDYLAAASGGTKGILGTWEDTSADATGTAAHFRIFDTPGTTCHMQGSVTATSGGGDIELDNTSIAVTQTVTITTFTMTAGNA